MKKPIIEFKSVLDAYTDINLRNQHFDELSDEGKRLEIAWDALKLITKKKVIAAQGWYWDSNLFYAAKGCASAKILHTFLNESLPECSVCARGAVMLSTIRLGNKVKPSSFGLASGHSGITQGFYSSDMIAMEAEYEHNYYNLPYKKQTIEKLMNILCNILVNGNFNTSDTRSYLK